MGCWMTERERCMNKLLLCIADMMYCEDGDPERRKVDESELRLATSVFREASAKQYDEDRNGARRMMGKPDCPEPASTTLEIISVSLSRDISDDPSGFWVAEYKPGILTEGKTIPDALRNLAEAVECAEGTGDQSANGA